MYLYVVACANEDIEVHAFADGESHTAAVCSGIAVIDRQTGALKKLAGEVVDIQYEVRHSFGHCILHVGFAVARIGHVAEQFDSAVGAYGRNVFYAGAIDIVAVESKLIDSCCSVSACPPTLT